MKSSQKLQKEKMERQKSRRQRTNDSNDVGKEMNIKVKLNHNIPKNENQSERKNK